MSMSKLVFAVSLARTRSPPNNIFTDLSFEKMFRFLIEWIVFLFVNMAFMLTVSLKFFSAGISGFTSEGTIFADRSHI